MAASGGGLLLKITAFIINTLGLGPTAIIVALSLIGFAILAAFGWWLLKILGRRYQKKRYSDQSLMLDSIWLLFAAYSSLLENSGGAIWALTGIAAFAIYKIITLTGFAVAARHRKQAEEPEMLLLRVFSLGKRSERMFDRLSRVWLRAGAINLIAGPDLVTSTIEPHEFLDFVGGQLSRRFVRDTEDLKNRLNEIDIRPDPDGCHRVNEFFCQADTWKETMRQLSLRSDVVLMDLRSFSEKTKAAPMN